MLIDLKLTNFKKHESLHVTLGEGLLAIKGANEAGKSTLFHAVLYAWFGSRALPMSLADTVTYGKPESSLRVELTFAFEGVEYRISRAKSGAMLTSPHGTVNGQSEVTKYVEGLFSVTADSASKIMLASQNGLRGALESNDAVSLIEKLANLDVLDDLISRIQKQLPCGNTSQIVENLEGYRGLAAPQLNAEDEEATVSLAKAAVDDLEHRLSTLTLPFSTEEIEKFRLDINQYNEAKSRKAHMQEHITALTSMAERELTKPDSSRLTVLEALIEESRLVSIARLKFKEFKNFKQSIAKPVEGDAAELATTLEQVRSDITKATSAKAVAEASLIKESHCGLCGKDLTEVPEVVAKNANYSAQAEAAAIKLASLRKQLTELQAQQEELLFTESERMRVKVAHAKFSDYAYIDSTGLKLVWREEPDAASENQPDYKAELSSLKAALQKYDTEVAVREGYKLQLVETLKAEAAIVLNHKLYDIATVSLVKVDECSKQQNTLRGSLASAKTALMSANHNLELQKKAYEKELAVYEAALKSKEKLEETLAQMNKHNALIRKLRELRPKVAAELWSIVLASVSSHFSAIRGTPSVVTRSPDGFLVDGRPAKGLSGSTLDSLGLAIRVALNRTFLPSIQFLLLDEPAAGMSDEREAAMLGLLASLNYKQVLVVTHSNLADTFASGIVQV